MKRWAIILLVACASLSANSADRYKPLFSEDMLSKADPETRARLEAMDAQNRERWLERQTVGEPAASNASTSARTGGSGGLYKYRDAEGRVQFSDKPVAGAESVTVDVARPNAASKAQYEASLKEQSKILDYFEAKNAEKAQAAADRQSSAENERQHKESCDSLFNDLQDQRRGGLAFYDLGPDGNRIYLSDAEVEARTVKMESEYIDSCGKLPAYDLR